MGPQSYADRRKERIDSLAASAVDETPGVSLIASAWRRLRRNPVFLIGLTITVLFVILAIVSPWIAPHDPAAAPLLDKVRPQTNPVPGPEAGFPLGADDRGRDLLSRLLVGSRQTLVVGVFATLFGLSGGLVLGTLSGALGGWVDSLVMRIVDVMLSIPPILLAIITVAVLGPGLQNLVLVLGLTRWPRYTRVAYGQTLGVVTLPFITAARLGGARDARLLFRHVFPNIVAPLTVVATIELGLMVLFEAGLSFLGLGTQPPTPSWGWDLKANISFIQANAWLSLFPGLAIFVTVLGFNLFGDGLRDALDPRLK